MPTNHIVEQGECLASIAHQYGFRDYHSVYDHALNADLRQKRPNPNLIHPGDTVVIPDKEPKTESCATGKIHNFVVKHVPRQLRLRLHYDDGDPIANTDYVLTCGDVERRGKTDAQGRLVENIPLQAQDAKIETAVQVWDLKVAHLNPMEDVPDDGISGFQSRLRNLGYHPGPIDGIAGAKTKRAVRAFQDDNPPLTVDGICGPKTKAKLKELHGS